MSNNSESFRNELVTRLFDQIPQEQLKNVISILDATMSSYDITRKPVELIPANGLPEVVKYFLASKAVENLSRKTLDVRE